MHGLALLSLFFFFNDTATTEIYTLSLHDALPISLLGLEAGTPESKAEKKEKARMNALDVLSVAMMQKRQNEQRDRKSTRLNSSHDQISYAVFCLKKKKKRMTTRLELCERISDYAY